MNPISRHGKAEVPPTGPHTTGRPRRKSIAEGIQSVPNVAWWAMSIESLKPRATRRALTCQMA
jgi:hypothetical protein